MQNFRAPGADPVPSAAGGFAPKSPASSSRGLRPQTPKTAPPLRILGYATAQSFHGMGGVLSQFQDREKQVIAYASRMLSKA